MSEDPNICICSTCKHFDNEEGEYDDPCADCDMGSDGETPSQFEPVEED